MEGRRGWREGGGEGGEGKEGSKGTIRGGGQSKEGELEEGDN